MRRMVKNIVTSYLLTGVIILFVCVTTNTAIAGQTGTQYAATNTNISKLTFIDKVNYSKKLVTAMGQTFKVTDKTNIIDQKGRLISLKSMPVPCAVELTYAKSNNTLVALAIRVVKELSPMPK